MELFSWLLSAVWREQGELLEHLLPEPDDEAFKVLIDFGSLSIIDIKEESESLIEYLYHLGLKQKKLKKLWELYKILILKKPFFLL